jgi:hypothetical protein
MTSDDRDEFSVAVFHDDGTYYYIIRWVNAERAFKAFRNCIRVAEHPRAEAPPVKIIITDGGDCTNAEWKLGEGLTYPKPDTPVDEDGP